MRKTDRSFFISNRFTYRGILFLLVLVLCFSTLPVTASAFIPSPQTEYSQEFIAKCQGSQWFIDETERLLNQQGKSINTLVGRDDLTNLRASGLADKQLEGEILPAIGELYNLEYIFLSENQLTGEIPDEIYSLSRLKNLDLPQNQLTGKISNLSILEELNLHDNSLSGSIPESIADLSSLRNLDLAQNKLTSSLYSA